MTYGGFVTIRSNSSSVTGSNRSPSRRSTSMELILAVSRASWTARGLRSEATTVRACWARCRLCTPQPVPRSRARFTGRRMVNWASVVEAVDTPSTKSGRIGAILVSRCGERSDTTHPLAPSSLPYGRMSSRATTSPADSSTMPAAMSGSTSERPYAGHGAVAAEGPMRLVAKQLDDRIDGVLAPGERRCEAAAIDIAQHPAHAARGQEEVDFSRDDCGPTALCGRCPARYDPLMSLTLLDKSRAG